MTDREAGFEFVIVLLHAIGVLVFWNEESMLRLVAFSLIFLFSIKVIIQPVVVKCEDDDDNENIRLH